MVAPALIAGGAQLVGGLLGGRKRRKEAGRQQALAQRLADEAVQAAQREQGQVLELQQSDIDRAKVERAADEARLREASGYDLVRLREQAKIAGFNPLTVLQATGGAGYDGRGAVLTTPFISKAAAFVGTAGDYWNRVNASMGTGAAKIETAGYVGDAISGGGSAYFAQKNADAQLQLERERNAAMREDQAMTRSILSGRGSGASVSNGSPFHDAPVRKVDAAHKEFVGPRQPVMVRSARGVQHLDPEAADRLGLTDGDWLTEGDRTELLGEAIGELEAITTVPFARGPFTNPPPPRYTPGDNPEWGLPGQYPFRLRARK